MPHYNTVIIGGGIGGYTLAANLGVSQKVLLIEKHYLGGTCLNYGCIPTKTLLESSKLFHTVSTNADLGVTANNLKADITQIVERKNKIVSTLRYGIETMLKTKNVDVLTQTAEFISDTTIKIKETDETITADNIVIATGSVQRQIPNIIPDAKQILTSDDILNLKEIPKTILIVGGGVIGCEMAVFLSELGTKVTIAEIMPNIMPMLDADIHKLFLRTLKKKKINVITDLAKIHIKKNQTDITATLTGKKEITENFTVALNATGRVPNLPVGIENTSIKHEKNTIITDDNLKTSVPNIYAIGDVTTGPMLAHKAAYDANLVTKSILQNKITKKDYRYMPYCTYTHPEIATVGLTEKEASDRNINLKTSLFSLKLNGRAHSIGSTDGALKLIANTDTQTLIGAHILAPNASEIISTLTLAITSQTPLSELKALITPHPTLSESISEALHDLA